MQLVYQYRDLWEIFSQFLQYVLVMTMQIKAFEINLSNAQSMNYLKTKLS